MLDRTTAEAVLARAVRLGADYGELFYEDSESTVLQMQESRVETANYSHTRGVGVRVLLGERCAYAYTADCSLDALLDTADAAAAGLGACLKERVPSIRLQGETKYAFPQQQPLTMVKNDRRVELLRRMDRAARAASGQIRQVTAGYLDTVQRVMVATTTGVFAIDERPRTRAFTQVVAAEGASAQTGFEGPGCRMGFEAYATRIDVEAAAQTAANTAVTMLHAPDCPAGRMPVVIDGGFGGVIFHEACGHSLEATSVGKGNSVFCGKLQTPIASPLVTAVDDGTLAGEWGSLNVDDEGMPTRRNLLIEKGVLKGYLVDLLGSRRMGMPITGSSRRQSYAFAPTSRMTNTFICPGQDEEEEMIASMGEGLYAKRMGGGSVNPATGEFNFAVSEGYWVKDGRVVSPVRGATLIGKGEEVLLNIDRVGKKMWMAQGMCGSLSGSIPTNVGQPRIRVSGLTVGGKGGKV